MSFPSVTYTFTNGTTSDATQVNQNFTDLINGMSDGTKDININNLTTAGTITFSGLTASVAVFTNASKQLVSNAITGTGSVVMSASPTLTGTITAAAATFSSTVGINGDLTINSTKGKWNATVGNIILGSNTIDASSGLNVSTSMTGLSGSSQYGVFVSPTHQSSATVMGVGVGIQPRTAASSFTMATANGVHIFDAVAGSGSTITTYAALDIDALAAGGTNYAIRTGSTGLIQFGSLTASQAVLTDGSKNLVSVATTGSGNVVRATSPTIATPTITSPSISSPTFSGTIGTALSASLAVFTDGSGNLTTNALTGSGSVMMSASPTTTGTLTAAAANFSGAVGINNDLTINSTKGKWGATNGNMVIGTSTLDAASWLNLTGSSGLTGTTNYGLYTSPLFQSTATTAGYCIGIQSRTQATAFTQTTAAGIHIFDASKGAGSTITNQVGLEIDNQTQGGTNYAIKTGTGLVQLGGLTASQAVFTDGSKNLVSNAITGSGNVVMSASPTFSGSVVFAGATDGASNVQVGGSFSNKVTALTGNTTLDATYHTIEANATTASFTITLPAASGCIGRVYVIHKNDTSANTVTIARAGSDVIDGATSVVLCGNTGNSHLIIKSNGGTAWRVEDLYEEGTISVQLKENLSGSPANIGAAQTWKWARVGNTVSYQTIAVSGTSTTTDLGTNTTPIPSALRTKQNAVLHFAAVRDNGLAVSTGAIQLNTAGDITFFVTEAGGAFTSSSTKGLQFNSCFSYTIL